MHNNIANNISILIIQSALDIDHILLKYCEKFKMSDGVCDKKALKKLEYMTVARLAPLQPLMRLISVDKITCSMSLIDTKFGFVSSIFTFLPPPATGAYQLCLTLKLNKLTTLHNGTFLHWSN